MKKTKARIRQGTTPVLEIIVEGRVLQDATISVTIDQGDKQLTKTNYMGNPAIVMEPIFDEETDEQIATAIFVFYSQAESLMLRPGHGKVQVKWVFSDGTADASQIGMLEIMKAYYKEVLPYGR